MGESARDDDYVAALTGARALAALWVFTFHAWLNAGSPTLSMSLLGAAFDVAPIARFGWLGVDIFFVLSGFLLTRQNFGRLKRPRSDTGSALVREFGDCYGGYLKRRILRVYPAYYASLAVLLAFATARIYGELPGRLDLLLHLVMMHNVVERYIVSMNGVFWTLPFEWHFYLIFPFLFVLLRRHGPLALYAGVVAGVLLVKALVMVTGDGYPQVYLPIRLDAFAAGMCAGAYAAQHRLPKSTASLLFMVGLALLFATPWVFSNHPGVHHYYDAAGFVRPFWIQSAIVAVLLGLTGVRHPGVALFDNRIVVLLGFSSYSIYLLHVPMLELAPRLAPWLPGYASAAPIVRNFGFALPMVIACSALWYVAFERPFQRSIRSQPSGLAATLARLGPMRVLTASAAALMALRMAAA